MNENAEPDWLAELAKGGEALRRQMESIVQAAEQFAASGPARPLKQGITRAVGELLSAPKRPVAHQAIAELAVAVGAAASATVTASGSLTLPPMVLVADGDVATASENGTVEVLSRGDLAALSDGQIVFLVLVWLYALVLPWVGSALPPEFHAVLSDGYATFALALTITWRMLDKRNGCRGSALVMPGLGDTLPGVPITIVSTGTAAVCQSWQWITSGRLQAWPDWATRRVGKGATTSRHLRRFRRPSTRRPGETSRSFAQQCLADPLGMALPYQHAETHQ